MKHKPTAPFVIVFMLMLFLFPQHLEAQCLEELFHFDRLEETLYCAYSLYEEETFELGLDEEGRVVVNSSCNDADLLSFIALKAKEFCEFETLPKLEFGEMIAVWREALPEEIEAALVTQANIKANAQNNLCALSNPFCTNNGLYEFPAGVNSGSGESGPYYACLRTQPNPAWYYMRILDSGDMDINMYSTPSVDIDFCCWGPFDDPFEPCPYGLTRQKVVSCSYLTNSNETCEIRNAQEGEYYILLITNYSNRVCNINFSAVAGEASTDCNILPPLVSYEAPACEGNDLHFSANGDPGSTFSWFQLGGTWTSTEQNPVRHNATLEMSGTYGCAISRDGQQSDTTYIEVVIGENSYFEYNEEACDVLVWQGVEYTEGGVFHFSYPTASGCDSIVDLNITMNYTPNFEITGNHWPIGGSETYISVNEYAIALDNPSAQVDTVLWSVDCENWRVVPHGHGENCTIYIFSFLEEPVDLHAVAVNVCDSVRREFFIQTSYFGVEETADKEWFTIVPNPNNGAFTLDFGSMQGQVEVSIYDAQGRQVGSRSGRANEGLRWDMEGLPSGLYLVRSMAERKSCVRKLLINK